MWLKLFLPIFFYQLLVAPAAFCQYMSYFDHPCYCINYVSLTCLFMCGSMFLNMVNHMSDLLLSASLQDKSWRWVSRNSLLMLSRSAWLLVGLRNVKFWWTRCLVLLMKMSHCRSVTIVISFSTCKWWYMYVFVYAVSPSIFYFFTSNSFSFFGVTIMRDYILMVKIFCLCFLIKSMQ